MAEDREKRMPLEELVINSGSMLVIDQYMLGNPQFVEKLEFGEGFSKSVGDAARLFGGAVISVGNGNYQVARDSQESLICLSQGGENIKEREHSPALEKAGFESVGRVFVDTRCVVFADTDLLNDQSLLQQYRKSREESGEKSARDLLRSKGASVKYGFNRFGDELGIFHNSSTGSVALWPDVVEDPS